MAEHLRAPISRRGMTLGYNCDTVFHTFDFHAHEDYEIFYFQKGEVQYYLEEQAYSLVPGDLLLIPPSVMHRAVMVDENALYQRYILMLSDVQCCKLLDGVDGIFTRRQVKPMHISLQGEDREEVHRKLEQMMRLPNDSAGRLAGDSLCTLLLLQLEQCAREQKETLEESTQQAQEYVRYINAHFTEPITLEDVAKRFFISKTHLMRQFKKYTNTTVHNYITSKRLLLAKALLKEGFSLTEAATACGFASYAAFYQAFVHHEGVRPTQHRRQNKQ